MLTISGKVVSVTPVQLKNRNTGEEFFIYNAYVVDGGRAPVKVKFTEKVGAPKLDQDITQPVFIRPWTSKAGRSGFEIIAFNPEKKK